MRFIVWLSIVLWLTGCSSLMEISPTNQQEVAGSRPFKEFNNQLYQHWQRSGDKVLWVNTQHSYILVSVFKGGSLARLGHDHVVVVHDLIGAVDDTKGVGDFSFKLNNMAVDEENYRAMMHLPLGISEGAIKGTRSNMLNKVLFADQYPLVTIHAQKLKDNPGFVGLVINLHGVAQRKIIAYQAISKGGHLHIIGQTAITQTQFGIKPFSVLAGALEVKNELNIQFDIEI